MKKVVILVVAAMMMAACGGGGIGGGSKSGLKKNEFLGNLPAIYADYALAEKALKKEKEALLKERGITENMSNNEIRAMLQALDSKEKEKFMERAEALDDKDSEIFRAYIAAVKAEMAILGGKPLQFTTSEAFNKLKIEVLDVRMHNESADFEARIVAKEDFEITRDNSRMYDYVCYREVAKDGSTIYAGLITIRHSRGNIKKGWTMINEGSFGFYLTGHAEHYVDFERIEFINREEYNKYNEEARIKL